ncbi:hypothetical protein D3C87_1022910 [compost metagenome]
MVLPLTDTVIIALPVIDIYLKDTKDNRQNLIYALDKMGYGRYDMLLDVPIIAGYCEVLMDDGMYADLMTDIPGLDKTKFDEYFEMATVDEINGVKVRFLHYNHLLIIKEQRIDRKINLMF